MFRYVAILMLGMGLQTVVTAQDADVKVLSKTLESTLAAYNKEDVKAFFKDWAKIVEALKTEQTFNGLYKTAAKSQLGTYKANSLTFVKEGSVLTGDFLVVYFDAEFAKGKAKVSVNFTKEADGYKVMQLKLEKK